MRRRQTAAIAAAALTVIAACGNKGGAPSAGAASARPDTAAAAATSATATEPLASAAASAASVEAPSGPPSKLVLVAESDGWIKVLPGARGGLIRGDADYESWTLAIGFDIWIEVTAIAPYLVKGGEPHAGNLVAASTGGFSPRGALIASANGTHAPASAAASPSISPPARSSLYLSMAKNSLEGTPLLHPFLRIHT